MFGRKRKPRTSRVSTLIGRQSRVAGDIAFAGGLHIDGTVKGNVRAEEEHSFLTLSETGTIEGEVRVPYVILNGVVKGDVHAVEHVELASNARIEGNVHYRLIEMAMGAEVNGKLVRIADEAPAPIALRKPDHVVPDLLDDTGSGD
jgi:cytoskeletal protein CcmA (bactofilin family)